MRAVSLSNPKIIESLNAYYVPVYLSNEDYADTGPATKEEKAELDRIHREGLAKGLSVGSVHAYILAPDGSVRDSMHTAQAAKADQLLAMLDRNARALHVAAGPPVVAPTPHPPPPCALGETQVSLIARYLVKNGNDLVPVRSDSGDWSSLPSEDWFSLTSADRVKLLAGCVAEGSSWTVDPAVANKLLVHFYPPTENWDLEKNTIRESALTAKVESVVGSTARVAYTGHLRMDHWFYHKPDGRYVEADVTGYADVDVKTRTLLRFRLVTERADYKGGQTLPFGVALRSFP